MPFAGNLRTLPLPDVLQTLNNIKATGVLRLQSNAGARDVVFQQGEIIGVGFLDKENRNDLELRLALLGIDEEALKERLKGATWYWSAMQARSRATRAEMDELVHEQAREQLHNLFAWNTADFAFDESGNGKTEANEMVARALERPLSIDTATLLLEAARQQDEWAELRARIRDETGQAAMGSQPSFPAEPAEPAQPEDPSYHLYLDGEWRGPFPRSAILGLVQTGEITPETWSYDPRTQERETLDKVLGSEARRITPDELDTLRQAVKAAEGRLNEERAGRDADRAEMRGLASEVLRIAREIGIEDPALSAVVERLAEAVQGEDSSLVALAAETVVVSLVRHLREGAVGQLAAARDEAAKLAARIHELERSLAAERAMIAEAERRADAERENASQLRTQLAQAAEDAAHLDQELERARRDPSHISTARISAIRSPEDIKNARAEAETASHAKVENHAREIGRMRAEHARLINEIAILQTRLEDERARHEAELEASRAVAATISERPAPVDDGLAAEVERLTALLAEAEAKADHDSDIRRAVEERDAARSDTERLRKDLSRARSEAMQAAEAAARGGEAEQHLRAATERIEDLGERLREADERAHIAEGRAEAAESRLRQTEKDLGEARERLAESEGGRADMQRQAYEAVRQNTELQVRLRELAARLDEGERRLAELGDLAGALAEARERAASLADEGALIRADLAEVRKQATAKIDRYRQRLAALKDRLRSARRNTREASAMRQAVPWPSPATATFAAAPVMPQASVPWPSPMTATYAAPGQPTVQTAAWQPMASPPSPAPSGAFPAVPAQPAASALAPRQAPTETALTDRPTSPWPAPSRPARRWRTPAAIAAAAVAAVAVSLAWISSSVPIATRAVINARAVQILADIPGELRLQDGLQEQHGRIAANTAIGEIRNDVDTTHKETLARRILAEQDRRLTKERNLRNARDEHDRLARELAEHPDSPDRTALVRLRDGQADRLIELQSGLDDLDARIAELKEDLRSESDRLDRLKRSTVTTSVEGVVWWANPSHSVPSGAPVATVAAVDSVVIEAEVDRSWERELRRGAKARVRVGGNEIGATVRDIDPKPEQLSELAIRPTIGPDSIRVILDVDPGQRAALCERLNEPVRVAVADPASGLFTRIAMALRF